MGVELLRVFVEFYDVMGCFVLEIGLLMIIMMVMTIGGL
jgi:hypothetical protein